MIKNQKRIRYHKYSQEVADYLIEHHKGKTLIELADMINKRFNMNINNKDVGNLKSRLKRRKGIYLEPAPNDGRYRKGQIPANKGKKWDEYLTKEQQEKAKVTCFKKGNKPSNAVEVGAEHMRYSGSKPEDIGYLYIKIADGRGNKNWIPKQQYIYEQHYGKIPAGHKVIFADGNRFNFDIENLILVSNSEELIMNQHNLRYNDKDLTKTGSIIAKVMDKANKVKNERL